MQQRAGRMLKRALPVVFLLGCGSSRPPAHERSLDGFLEEVGDLAATPSPSDLSRPPGAPDMGPTDLAHGASPFDGGLDPKLALPDPAAMPCDMPGALIECPGYAMCRPLSPTENRCQAAGNKHLDFCTSSAECDLLYACYDGFCTKFCDLHSTECGLPDDCFDVGSTVGVCNPH
jgi:hypothetical protein